jgi:hypothetical protein
MVDGVQTLHRRANSRLWYRQLAEDKAAVAAPQDEAIGDVTMSVEAEPKTGDEYAYFEGANEFTVFDLDTTGMTLRQLNFRDPHVARALHGNASAPVATERPVWRTFPATAPALILSASEHLGARVLGPVLNPDARFRVVDSNNGVIGVEIDRLGLPPMRGYCTSVDLSAAAQCARPKRTSSQTAWLRSVSAKVSNALGAGEMPLSNAAIPSRD